MDKSNVYLVVAIVALVLFVYLALNFQVSDNVDCSTDEDCEAAGCSGSICILKGSLPDLATTCEWREEYGCLEFTSCGCFEGKCSFEQNEDYLNCMEGI